MISKILEKIFFVKISLAGEMTGTGSAGEGITVKLKNPLGETSSITGVLDHIASYLVIIATAVVPVMVIIGAFYMLFSAGDPEKMKTGRKAILYSVIGFIIIISAKGIIAIVKNVLVTE